MPTAQGEAELRRQIGQMLLVGFRGCELADSAPIVEDVRDRNLGGVVLFDEEMTDGSRGERNVRSPAQLRKLVTFLQGRAQTPLFIAIDQEGGRVNRLKASRGFPETLSHEELGQLNDPARTFAHAEVIASTLAGLGINLNLAPVVDLDANPNNPIISGKGRSFSADPRAVATHAAEFVRAHREHGVLTCAKHFPGHGSARGDTHHGLVDVTDTWRKRELLPFKHLIDSSLCDMIMSAHVFNANLDPDRPATLSPLVLTGILRNELRYRGVIVSDDLEMKAIAGHYGLEKAVEEAINAGVDVLCFGNNMNYDAGIARKAIDIIAGLVKSGRVTSWRIEEASSRVLALKRRAGILG
ncbi:MAG: glycoside hydrolase family 3 protein [Verrucomicrobiota bacterium]